MGAKGSLIVELCFRKALDNHREISLLFSRVPGPSFTSHGCAFSVKDLHFVQAFV